MDFFGAQDTILTTFVKFKISNNFKRNIDETHSKLPKIHRKIHTSKCILKISRKKSVNQKPWGFCQMFVVSKKENHTLGVWIKKSIVYSL
jgi:hypothetical protein